MVHSRTLKQMISLAVILLVMTLVCRYLYYTYHHSWMMSMYVTLLTVSYHLIMRLVVGETITAIYKKREFNMNSVGFCIRSYEAKLYRILNVKKWKNKVITAKPEQFDLKKVSTKELLHNVLQAELVHRIIMVLSFLPLLLIFYYGAPLVFVLTSVFACMVDMMFVIIQRYNRTRIIRLMDRCNKR